jgi:hypothetical protein
MRRRSWLKGLQWQLLLWAGIAVVAVSLLAMHQLSASHTAAGVTTPVVAASDRPGGHNEADLGSSGHAHSSDHSHDADQSPYVAGAGLGGGPFAPVDSACPGCGEHQAMALTCLVALTSLAVGWLLAGPVQWPGLLPRYRLRRLPQDVRRRWRRLPFSLVELSVSRT